MNALPTILLLVGYAISAGPADDKAGAKAAEAAKDSAKIKHSFFIAGPSFTGIIDEDGNEEWDSLRAGARDGYVLDNGNILIAWSDVVQELSLIHI